MNETSTYPPSPSTSTSTVPPSTPTAFTGSQSDIPAIGGIVFVLSLVGAVALTFGLRRAKRFAQ